MSPTVRHVAVGDARVAYTVEGEGPPLVLAHGAGATKDTNWGALAGLRARYTLVAPDLPGSGGTTDGGRPLDLDALAAQLLAVADAVGAERFHLAGYSLGAIVAAAVAGTAPGRVRSLALVAPWTHADAHLRHEFDLWQRLFAVDRELWVRFAVLTGSGPGFFAAADAHPDQVSTEGFVQAFLPLVPHGVGRQAELITRADVRAHLARITAPTRVVGLTHDQQIPVAHARAVHARLAGVAGAEYVELAAGHVIPWQQPDDFARVIAEFVDQIEARTHAAAAPGARAGAAA